MQQHLRMNGYFRFRMLITTDRFSSTESARYLIHFLGGITQSKKILIVKFSYKSIKIQSVSETHTVSA